MRRIMVRYKVKPDQAAENEQLVRSVYHALQQAQPTGFRYATFRLDDGLTFVHLASHEAESNENPLTGLEAFRQFQENIGDRCDEAPVVSELHEIGAFRFFDAEETRSTRLEEES
jgi:hypothetical protein